MQNKLTINERKINSIITKSEHRGSLNSYKTNFISNITDLINFRIVLNESEYLNKYKPIYFGNHLVSLVSCIETAFRDIFIYSFSNDETFRESILSENNFKINNLTNIEVSEAESISELCNFQNTRDIEKIFKFYFEGDYFNELGKLTIPYFKNKGDKEAIEFNLDSEYPNWKSQYEFLIEERHKIIHDCNFKTSVTLREIEEIENIVLFSVQLFFLWLVNRFSQGWFFREDINGLKVPWIIGRENLNDRWTIERASKSTPNNT